MYLHRATAVTYAKKPTPLGSFGCMPVYTVLTELSATYTWICSARKLGAVMFSSPEHSEFLVVDNVVAQVLVRPVGRSKYYSYLWYYGGLREHLRLD